jgi:precorrin-3B synthase
VFADCVRELRLGADDKPTILTAPLLGLEPPGGVDFRDLIVELTAAVATQVTGQSLNPKLSVLIDAEGALHLDAVPADIRLRAGWNSRFHLSIGGDATTAVSLGWIESHRAVPVVVDLVKQIAGLGPSARANNLLTSRDPRVLRSSVVGIDRDDAPPRRSPAQAIGRHPLQSGKWALGIALPFGFATADKLKRLAQAAEDCGASSIRPAPDRALLSTELTTGAAEGLASVSLDEGFVVDAQDARRSVVACAGAPACSSGTVATRRLAPLISRAAGTLLDGSLTIHVSGCAKGCAHPGVATLTVIGPDRLVILGSAGDIPHGFIDPSNLVAGLTRLETQRHNRVGQGSSHEFVTQLGARAVVRSIGGTLRHG